MDWFYYRAVRRKELCTRRTKIKRRVPKPQWDKMLRRAKIKKPGHHSRLLFFNRGELTALHTDEKGEGLTFASGRQRENRRVGGVELDELLFCY